jgi:NAD(P)-dependent dehydrogenase (short-subunit alcohol dehydrogenase family)
MRTSANSKGDSGIGAAAAIAFAKKGADVVIAYYYRYSRQCGSTGADLGTAHSGELFCGIYRVKVGDGCTGATAGTAL